MKQLLEYSIKHNLKHIPSALSQYSYLKVILPLIHRWKDWNICIGKPFGSQAYYCIWEDLGILPSTKLSYGVKHKEIPFVNYSEETLGNALGVAAGIALGSSKKTYVNISDGALQMGNTLEAIQFIGKQKLPILCTVDFNGMQLTGSTSKIMGINIDQQAAFFESFGWKVYIMETNFTKRDIVRLELYLELKRPTVILFKTVKGQGVQQMEKDPVLWHYRELKDINEIDFS